MTKPVMSHNGQELIGVLLLLQFVVHSPLACYVVQHNQSTRMVGMVVGKPSTILMDMFPRILLLVYHVLSHSMQRVDLHVGHSPTTV